MIFAKLPKGEYIIHLEITAQTDTLVTAVTNHRRFLLRNMPMKNGEAFAGDFAAAVRDADFQKQPSYRDNFIEVKVSGECQFNADIKPVNLQVVYCLGDSTVCDQSYDGGSDLARCCGWGQTLGMFLKDRYAVSNHAEQGTHTGDCLACHIKPVLEQLKPGDIVLAQFGHNDQKQKHLNAHEGYRENLIKIASLVKDRGGRCVLCTPINRLIYVDGQLNTYLEDYAAVVKDTADELGLSCIDLHAYTSAAYERLGKGAEDLFYHPENGLDRTHPNDNGGTFIGEYAAGEILKL